MSIERCRELLSHHGELCSQTAAADFPLPDSVARFYELVGPVDVDIRSYGNAFFLPRLANLAEYQAGYHGSGWNGDWLVVADHGADPFIVSRSTGEVLHCQHGVRVWRPEPMFRDIIEMATTLAIIGDVVAEAGEDFGDDDCVVREVWREVLRTRVGRQDPDAMFAALGFWERSAT